MTIDVDIPRCDEPFNVLINLTNTGSRTSPTGRLTLEDIRVRTGDVTHSSFANIPQINPQENSVLNVPMEASRFVGEEHELLATVGDEQFRITYILRQGSCEGDSASSNPPAQSSGRRFDPGECSIEILEPWLVYPTPQGTQTFTLQPSTYPALKVEIIDGAIWYEVNFADAGIWIPFDGGITRIGLCTP